MRNRVIEIFGKIARPNNVAKEDTVSNTSSKKQEEQNLDIAHFDTRRKFLKGILEIGSFAVAGSLLAGLTSKGLSDKEDGSAESDDRKSLKENLTNKDYRSRLISGQIEKLIPKGLRSSFWFYAHRYGGESNFCALSPILRYVRKGKIQSVALPTLFLGFKEIPENLSNSEKIILERKYKNEAKDRLLKFLDNPNSEAKDDIEKNLKLSLGKCPSNIKKELKKNLTDDSRSVDLDIVATFGQEKQTKESLSQISEWWPVIVDGFKDAIAQGYTITASKEVSAWKLLLTIAIESSGKVFAVSNASAVGLFQIIPATAEGLDIPMNSSYDGRLDPKQAATAYAKLQDIEARWVEGRAKEKIPEEEELLRNFRDTSICTWFVQTVYNQGRKDVMFYLKRAEDMSPLSLFYEMVKGKNNGGDLTKPSRDGASYALRYFAVSNLVLKWIIQSGTNLFPNTKKLNFTEVIISDRKKSVFNVVPNFKNFSVEEKIMFKKMNPAIKASGYSGGELPIGAIVRIPK